MIAGFLVGALLLWAITGLWFWLGIFAALYLWAGLRYGRRVRHRDRAYSWADWAVLLALWWLFAFFEWLNTDPPQ